MRKRVYIASPITIGDLWYNLHRATQAFHTLARLGFAPLCPAWSVYSGGPIASPTGGTVYALAETLPAGTEHEDWMDIDLPWVEKADAVLRIPGESHGADRETAHAGSLGIPVFHNINDLLAWARPSAEARGEVA